MHFAANGTLKAGTSGIQTPYIHIRNSDTLYFWILKAAQTQLKGVASSMHNNDHMNH